MAQPFVSDHAPGHVLFPEYATLFDLISPEVQGLSDEQLDWQSDRWAWSTWSIRQQLSHMSSVFYVWLQQRWGDTLFPDGGIDITTMADVDENHAHTLPVILDALKGGIELARRVLEERSVGFLRRHTYARVGDRSLMVVLMGKAHRTGVTRIDEQTTHLSLEWTLRHIYFEQTTHLYNIQRLKRAQGLSTVVEVPRVGYWVVDGWDRSEP